MSSTGEADGGSTEERRDTSKGGGGTDSNADISADAAGQHPLDHDDLHFALMRACKRSFFNVQRLLDEGHEFCRGDGLNCFIVAASEREYLSISQRWKMVKRMLEVDPRGIHVRDQDGFTLLHYFWTEVDMLKQLIELGPDLETVTDSGLSLLESLFTPHLISTAKVQQSVLEIWDILLNYKEIQNQATKESFLNTLILFKDKYPAPHMLLTIVKHDLLRVESLTRVLKMHPLFYIIDCCWQVPLKFFSWMNALEETHSIFKDKAIIMSLDITELECEGPADIFRWKLTQKVLNIPDKLTVDVFSYFLLKFDLQCELLVVGNYLTLFLKKGFGRPNVAGVVHPFHTLLYKYLSRIRPRIKIWHLPDILIGTITILNDYPVPHQLVPDPNKGVLMLDVHLLLSSVLHQAVVQHIKTEGIIDLIVALLQLSPLHPLQNFASLYYAFLWYNEGSGAYIGFDVYGTLCKLLRLLLEASGIHKFQGADRATIDCISCFCKALQQINEDSDWRYDLDPDRPSFRLFCTEVPMMLKAAVKAESKVSSLQWLCILQIRKTLFLNRTSNTTTLPSLIRTLVSEKYLPRGLEEDLLVYKPNDLINF